MLSSAEPEQQQKMNAGFYNMSNIEEKFHQAMLGLYQKAKLEAGYTASVFLGMLLRHRGLITAKQLINSQRPSDGYTTLYERERLDLTVEALVVENSHWHVLFTPKEIDKAAKRLRDYRYEIKAE